MSTVAWKYNEGRLVAGMVIKLPNSDVCYIVSTSPSSALMRYVSGYDKPITTRKGVTKIVTAHRPDGHISVSAGVLYLDPDHEYAKRIRERLTMSESATAEAPAAEKKTRAVRVYTRTDKQPEKELKGQGAIVLEHITSMESGTIAQVAEACKGLFKTRQSDERIVGFYLSKFKREGFVTTSETEAADAAAEGEAQPE